MLVWLEDHYVNDLTQAAWCGWVAACKHIEELGAIQLKTTETAHISLHRTRHDDLRPVHFHAAGD